MEDANTLPETYESIDGMIEDILLDGEFIICDTDSCLSAYESITGISPLDENDEIVDDIIDVLRKNFVDNLTKKLNYKIYTEDYTQIY